MQVCKYKHVFHYFLFLSIVTYRLCNIHVHFYSNQYCSFIITNLILIYIHMQVGWCKVLDQMTNINTLHISLLIFFFNIFSMLSLHSAFSLLPITRPFSVSDSKVCTFLTSPTTILIAETIQDFYYLSINILKKRKYFKINTRNKKRTR